IFDCFRYSSALRATWRGSRVNSFRLSGSTTLAITLTVGLAKKGSRRAVAGSGTAIMSDSWMPIQPRIDEPSNPRPSSKVPSSSVSTGNEQCCQLPSRSTNFRSTISARFFLAYAKNSFALLGKSSGVIGAPRLLRARPGAPGRALAFDVTEKGKFDAEGYPKLNV